MSKRNTKKRKRRKWRKKSRGARHKGRVNNKVGELHVELSLKTLILYWTSTALICGIGAALSGPLIYNILVPNTAGHMMYSLQRIAYGCSFLILGFILFVYGIVITYRMIMAKLASAKIGCNKQC